MSLLSDRQREELHKSLLDYLESSGYADSARALRRDLQLEDIVLDSKAKYAGLLEKKWTSVIRLQRKVIELESRNAQLNAELSSPAMATKRPKSVHFLPSAPKHTLSGHRSAVVSISFHPKFTLIASGSDDASIKVWDWDSAECERTLRGHTKAVLSLDYDQSGNLLASASSDTSIKLWDAAGDYANIKTLYGHDDSVSCVRFLANTNTLISSSRDQSIRFWEISSGYCTRTLNPHSDWIRGIIPTDDGKTLATASSDQTSMIVDIPTGNTIGELRGHEHVIECVAWAPTSSYQNISQLISENSSAIDKSDSNDSNRFLATGSRDKTIKLWDASTNQCVYTFNGHDSWVKSIMFHPAGTHLLSSSEDKSIKIWDLTTGRCTRTIEDAHKNFINSLTWGRQTMPDNANLNRRFSMPQPPLRSMSGGDVLRSVQQQAQSISRPLNVIASASSDTTIKNHHHIRPSSESYAAKLRREDASLAALELRIAGGWVRDKLLGKPSDDIDVAITPLTGLPFAEALAEYLQSIEPQQKISIARIDANPNQSKHLETARMKVSGYEVDFVNLRSETYATGSRIPQMSLGTPLEDALRRDITINSLFYNIHTRQVEDFTGKGLEDLKNGLVRTPLEPFQTFSDDPLRVLRCIRFATRYGFTLDNTIIEAAQRDAIRRGVCENVSKERIGTEIDKMLNSQQPLEALTNLSKTKLHDIVFGVSGDGVEGDALEASYALAAGHLLQYALYEPAKLGITERLSQFVTQDKLLIRRLWLGVALIPYFNMQVKEKKKIVTAPAFIASNCLKYGNAERAHIDNLVLGCNFIRENIRGIDLNDRVALASALRHVNVHRSAQGTDWAATVLFTLLQELLEVYYRSGCNDDDITSVVGLYNTFVESVVTTLDIPRELESRPILDGKRIISVLHLKPGPQIQEINEKVILWQLRHPTGGEAECEAFLLSEQAEGRIPGPQAVDDASKKRKK
ncbi:hypothetical protein E3Q01_00984 [Wallemia mellicola]|uniref:Nuclear distribution protein PAC1 n=1 Tax=Wallemia mellicola TaxID=1708541 RepID=A0A4V4N4B1_9BASI|nr:hypothetical protein E3Q01_00984 [Wallemia mellicola]